MSIMVHPGLRSLWMAKKKTSAIEIGNVTNEIMFCTTVKPYHSLSRSNGSVGFPVGVSVVDNNVPVVEGEFVALDLEPGEIVGVELIFVAMVSFPASLSIIIRRVLFVLGAEEAVGDELVGDCDGVAVVGGSVRSSQLGSQIDLSLLFAKMKHANI